MIRQSGEDGFFGEGVSDLKQSGCGEWGFDPKRSLGLWKSGPSTLVISRRNRQAKPAGDGRLHGMVGCYCVVAWHGPSPVTARIRHAYFPSWPARNFPTSIAMRMVMYSWPERPMRMATERVRWETAVTSPKPTVVRVMNAK